MASSKFECRMLARPFDTPSRRCGRHYRRHRALAELRSTMGLKLIVRASRWGGPKTGPNPTDRARPGSTHHVLVDANGVPVSAILTGANRNDVTQLLASVLFGGVRR